MEPTDNFGFNLGVFLQYGGDIIRKYAPRSSENHLTPEIRKVVIEAAVHGDYVDEGHVNDGAVVQTGGRCLYEFSSILDVIETFAQDRLSGAEKATLQYTRELVNALPEGARHLSSALQNELDILKTHLSEGKTEDLPQHLR